jgi:hypothetical protein
MFYIKPFEVQNMIRVIKLGMMRWAEPVERMGETRNAYNILVGNLKERDHLEELGVDGKIIVGCISRKWSGNFWIGCIRLRIRTNGGVL